MRRAYFRRSIKRARLHRRLLVTAVGAGAACAAFVLWQAGPRPDQDAATAAATVAAMPAPGAPAAQARPALLRAAASSAEAPARRVYPYSIVPGGVASRAELVHAVMADKIVAAHYAGFAVDKARLRTVAKARAVYVSYRKGEQVYWTAHKVTLAEGETVLTDGSNDIRARCGNRISDTPQLPVEVKGPDERELDTPLPQPGQDGGGLRDVAFHIDGQEGEGHPFTLPPIANGAGLLAAQPNAGLAEGGQKLALLGNLPGAEFNPGIHAASPAPAGLPSGSPSDSGSGGTGGSPTVETGGGSSTGDTGSKDPGGSKTPDSGGGSPGGNPGGTPGDKPGDKPGDPGKPPVPGLRPDTTPNGNLPTRTHELPEPDGLWLSGVAFAALLLQRRLARKRTPRSGAAAGE